METIPKSDCRKIGYIRKTHGVQGEVALEYEPELEESVAQAERFFIEIDGLLVPFFISEDGLRFKSAKTALLQFNWVDGENQARRLVGCPVYLYNIEIHDETIDYSINQFMNYHLQNENSQEIGIILAVDDYAGNVVFTVVANKQEILVPYNQELLLDIDKAKKIIKLRLPDGLLD